MFGMKRKKEASELAAKYKDPDIPSAKVDAVDTGESFRAEKPQAPKAEKKQSFKEAFASAKDGSTFTWNGKQYKKEYAKPKTESSKPSASTSFGPPTRGGMRNPKVPTSFGPPTRGGMRSEKAEATKPRGLFPDLQARRDAHFQKLRERRAAMGMKEPEKPDLSIPGFKLRTAESIRAERSAEEARRSAADKARGEAQRASTEALSKRVGEDLEKYKYGRPAMARGGAVESKGMKGGGSCGSMKKYARGGGVETHGKTKGTMIKMASGGSVSARADGIASKGKTNCKIC